METQNSHEITRREALEADLRRRAASLGMERDEYLQTLHDDDRTLEFDRAILATVLAWAPVWALLAALLSPQGQELLAEFESGTHSRFVLFIMLALLCIVASVFASGLIAGWFFPRIVDAVRGGGWLWPGIPKDLKPLDSKECREAFAWTALPAILSIAVPLAIVQTATFGLSGWLVNGSVWLCMLMVYSCMTLLTIYVANRFALEIISFSKVLIVVGLAGLLTLGLAPVWATSAIGTPTIVVAVAIFWLL